MRQMLPITLLVTSATSFLAPSVWADEKPEAKAKPKALTGEITFQSEEASFAEATVWVRLWEYDPFLADAAANKFAEVKLKNVAHTKGTATKTTFSLGDVEQVRNDRKYYVTIYVYRKGDLVTKNEIFFLNGFNKVTLPGKVSGTMKKLNR